MAPQAVSADGAPVVGFVGRLTADKGAADLADAFRELLARHPAAHLLLVGRFEDGDPIPAATRAWLESDSRVHLAGEVGDDEIPALMSLMTALALPSRREGFRSRSSRRRRRGCRWSAAARPGSWMRWSTA